MIKQQPMFPWQTLASHGLFHMCVQQTISPEIGVFRRVGCLSSPVNHGGISKNKDWSYGVVCFFFFSPRVLAIALPCFPISSLWSARAILRESGLYCQNFPTCATCTQVYLKAFHWLATSPWSDRRYSQSQCSCSPFQSAPTTQATILFFPPVKTLCLGHGSLCLEVFGATSLLFSPFRCLLRALISCLHSK